MKPDIKTKWVQALRSGKYNQAKAYLKLVDGEGIASHCCLGVLCELYQQETRHLVETVQDSSAAFRSHPDNGEDVHEFLGVHDLLPDRIASWAGLTGPNPVVPINPGDYDYPDQVPTAELSTLNDEGADFQEIADLIEKGL